MVKHIHLVYNEEFFYKMKKDKAKREAEKGTLISWEDYIKLLFGFK